MGPSQMAAIERPSPIATNGGKSNSTRWSQHLAITSGPIPAGSPSETASGESGARGTAAGPSDFGRLAEFDHRIAPKVAQIAPRAAVHALLVELIVDLVIARRTGIEFIAPADHQRSNALVERTERLGGLADLQRQHHLLERGREVAHLSSILLHDFAVEVGSDLVSSAAASDGPGSLGEARDDWLSHAFGRALGKADRHLLQAEDRIARIARQDFAGVLYGEYGNAARHRNWVADRPRGHLPERIGKRCGKLFRPDPPEVAADRSRRCFRILAGVAGERCAVLQLLKYLGRVGDGLRLRVRSRGKENFADVILLGTLRCVQLVDYGLNL